MSVSTPGSRPCAAGSRSLRRSHVRTGVAEVDVALMAYLKAEDGYGEMCDAIMEIESGSYTSSERDRLPELEAEVAIRRTSLADATRLLDQVCGPMISRFLRLGQIKDALWVIQRRVCRSCGGHAYIESSDVVLKCRRCRLKRRLLDNADPCVVGVELDEADSGATGVVARPVEPAVVVTSEPASEPVLIDEPVIKPAVDPVVAEFVSEIAEPHGQMSASDDSLATTSGSAVCTAGSRRINMAETKDAIGRSASQLYEAHRIYSDAYKSLAKAYSAGDLAEIEVLWRKLSAAEAAVANTRTSILAQLRLGKSAGKPVAVEVKHKETKPTPKQSKPPKPKRPGGDRDLSSWLFSVRTDLGLSQVAFAEKVGASRTQMWHWEKGNMTPGDEIVTKIEKLVGRTCPSRQSAAG